MGITRRTLLRSFGVGAAVGVAGCSTVTDSGDGSQTGGSGAAGETPGDGDETETNGANTDETDGPAPPTADTRLHLDYELGMLDENIRSGGVPKDGIPSIDEPSFTTDTPDSLDPADPVFGLVRDGEAKAYPQYILVHHEIVNDTIAGGSVSVTYCPLTGTVQGFERDSVEFGVSGSLLNSNLVMYDRGTDSWWPQMLATAVRGPLKGKSLREFRVVWTTWERWKAVHPHTKVLTEDTGYSRRYGTDPYGQYNSKRGYYSSQRTLFEPLQTDSRKHPKSVVIGTRTEDGALSFDKENLLDQRVLTGTIGETAYVAVADSELATGYVYANPDDVTVDASNDEYTVERSTYAPDELPLERSLAFDAMWFAWAGFYPEAGYVD